MAIKYRLHYVESERGWGQTYFHEDYDTRIEAESARTKNHEDNERENPASKGAPDFYILAQEIEIVEVEDEPVVTVPKKADPIVDIDTEVADLKKRIEKLEANKKALLDPISQSFAGKIALLLFDKYFRFRNHDESWYYEVFNDIHDWTGHSHAKYLRMAESLLKLGYTYDNIAQVLNILNG